MKFSKITSPKAILFYVFISIFNFQIHAQDELSSSDADSKSLQFFNDRNWDEVIKIGNEALANGYDYYYLRMRMGIAYYENKNYLLAEPHFKKGHEFNSNNDTTLEYLYYCYVFTGRSEQAKKLSKTFSLNLSNKIRLDKTPSTEFIFVEAGSKNANSPYNNIDNLTYYKPATYAQIGLKHSVNNNFSVTHAATYYHQVDYSGTVNQFQYYAQGAIPLNNNWLVSPAIHLVNTDFSSDTYTSFKKSYFVGSLMLKKSIKKIELGLGSTFSNTSDTLQHNHFVSISYAPFGNNQLIMGLTNYVHTIDDYATMNNSFTPFVYFEASPKTAFKLSYLNNMNNNIVEDNGSLVNNAYDLTENRLNILANFRINPKFTLYTIYQSENKKIAYDSSTYKYNVFLLGMKFYPTL